MTATVLDADQLACLASPARNEVFMRLRILGQASVGDISKQTGRSPEAVHYHVRALVQANLAREAFKRPGVKKPEAVFESVGKNLKLPKPEGDPKVSLLIRKSVAAGFRQTIRGYLKAAKSAENNPSQRELMHVIRMNARLSKRDAKELKRRIEDVVRFADRRRVEKGIKLVWSSIVFPMVEKD